MERVEIKSKELSSNKLVALFQKVWRGWLIFWYGCCNKKPKLCKLLYQFAMFWIFSMMVTIFQYVVMTFLPYAFGLTLAGKEFIWPGIEINLPIDNFQPFKWAILGYDVQMKAGEVVIGGGLGYFIAYELATFFAQVINFPLQRNITYKSHGNPYYQAMWYFIAWLIISVICNAITSFWIGAAWQFLPAAVYQILTTVITGGVSMVIFFFVFLIIFPDLDKVAAKETKKLEALKASNAAADVIAAQEVKTNKAVKEAKLSNARKEADITSKTAESKAVEYEAQVKILGEMKAKNATEEELAKQEANVEEKYNNALEALNKANEAKAALEALNA